MASKVGHVVLAVRDPEASAKFYVEALGKEVRQSKERNEFRSWPLGVKGTVSRTEIYEDL